MSATAEQIRRIHTLKSRAGLDDDTYRDLLERETGRRSSKEITPAQAARIIDHLQAHPGGGARPAPKRAPAAGALALDGPYVPLCRAIWLTGYNLGVFRERTDAALVAFVKRQTGIEHLNWVKDEADAGKVVEALKAWIRRETGMVWDVDAKILRQRKLSKARWRKLTVLHVQSRILGDVPPGDMRDFTDPQLDELIGVLGRRLRKKLAEPAR